MTYNLMENPMKAALIIVVLLMILLAPFATIWSLNTLFPVLNIPYGLDTWLAVIFLGGGALSIKKS
jgi:hypothetical protein